MNDATQSTNHQLTGYYNPCGYFEALSKGHIVCSHHVHQQGGDACLDIKKH